MTDNVFSEGRIAVVTGAALGIGRSACQRFVEMGMSVCLADLPGDDLTEAEAIVKSAALNGSAQVLVHPTDVSDPAQLRILQSTVANRFGDIHVLMNNAVTRIGRDDPEQWRKAMDTNFWGVVEGCQAFVPAMLASGAPGRIINVGSKQGITNPPGNTIYNVAKSAVKIYTEALQHELRSNSWNQGAARPYVLS